MHYNPGTKISVTFVDEHKLVGIVDHYTSVADSPDEIEELTIIPVDGKLKGRLVCFNETEVKHIKLIE